MDLSRPRYPQTVVSQERDSMTTRQQVFAFDFNHGIPICTRFGTGIINTHRFR